MVQAPMDVHPSTIIGERLKLLYGNLGIPVSERAQQWIVESEAEGYRVELVVRLPSGRCQKFFFRKKAFKRVQLGKLYVADRAIKSGVLDFIDSETRVCPRRSSRTHPALPKQPSLSFDTCPDFIPLESDSESEYESDPGSSSRLNMGWSLPATPISSPKKGGKLRPRRYFE